MDRHLRRPDLPLWRLERADLHRSASAPPSLLARFVARGAADPLNEPTRVDRAMSRGFDGAGLWVRIERDAAEQMPAVLMELHYLSLHKGPVDIAPWLAVLSEDDLRGFAEDPGALEARHGEILKSLVSIHNPTMAWAVGRAGLPMMEPLLDLKVLDPEGLRARLNETIERRAEMSEPIPDFA